MNSYLALGLAIVAEVIATTALKASDSFTRLGPSLLAVVFYESRQKTEFKALQGRFPKSSNTFP